MKLNVFLITIFLVIFSCDDKTKELKAEKQLIIDYEVLEKNIDEQLKMDISKAIENRNISHLKQLRKKRGSIVKKFIENRKKIIVINNEIIKVEPSELSKLTKENNAYIDENKNFIDYLNYLSKYNN